MCYLTNNVRKCKEMLVLFSFLEHIEIVDSEKNSRHNRMKAKIEELIQAIKFHSIRK